MAQQTAVEWLEKKINIHLYVNEKTANIISGYFQQANQMFEEQIEYAHLTGLIHPLEMEASKQAEQYYNETYGK